MPLLNATLYGVGIVSAAVLFGYPVLAGSQPQAPISPTATQSSSDSLGGIVTPSESPFFNYQSDGISRQPTVDNQNIELKTPSSNRVNRPLQPPFAEDERKPDSGVRIFKVNVD